MAENKFLDKINSPADVKKLSVPQLEQLAKEIRQLLISVISHWRPSGAESGCSRADFSLA